MSEPDITLSCCVSADGFLDSTAPERAVLSSPEDLEAVLDLRARSDMIVIGAQTLRRDDPSLATRGARHVSRRARDGRDPDPVKLVLTRGGPVPADRAFFRDGSAETIVLSATPVEAPGTVVTFEGDPVDAVLGLARERGLRDILVEGGAQVLNLFRPRARWWRLAVSDTVLGAAGHAHLLDPLDIEGTLDPVWTQDFGGTAVHHIDLHRTRARDLMLDAIALSRRSPRSDTAFAVGSIACDARMRVLATGFSRETGPHDHAEEAMLAKLDGAPHTVVVTLEPCGHRASKPVGCAHRLVQAGVQRVYYAVAEDGTFTAQSGLAALDEAGVELIHLPGFAQAFRDANPALYGRA